MKGIEIKVSDTHYLIMYPSRIELFFRYGKANDDISLIRYLDKYEEHKVRAAYQAGVDSK